jgi:hypothetical protein
MDREKLEPYAGREQASVKHFLLESYLERLIMITARTRYDRIAYVDAFAGPWKSAREDLTDTSFAKAIEVMHACRIALAKQFHRAVLFRALFVERDQERFARLKKFAHEKSTAEVEMRAYLNHLRVAAGNARVASQLRTAWFPVEFPSKNRIFYYLTYVTHHVKGMIVFLQESERALHYQRQMKFVVKQKRREADTGMADIFGDTLHGQGNPTDNSESDARSLWLEVLPSIGSEAYIDESRIADMAETCGCLVSRLQSALRVLIEQRILENVDAERTRPKNVVNHEKGETIRRLK